jgi:hypothetical protein
MSVIHEPPALGYLDAIFASIRAFGQELDASRSWLGRAEQTENQAWRLSFLREARASYERTPARLEAIADHLRDLGPAGALPAPLDRIEKNLTTMRADLDAHERRLLGLEATMARGAAPIGEA